MITTWPGRPERLIIASVSVDLLTKISLNSVSSDCSYGHRSHLQLLPGSKYFVIGDDACFLPWILPQRPQAFVILFSGVCLGVQPDFKLSIFDRWYYKRYQQVRSSSRVTFNGLIFSIFHILTFEHFHVMSYFLVIMFAVSLRPLVQCLFGTGRLLGLWCCSVQHSRDMLIQTASQLTRHFLGSSAIHPSSMKSMGCTFVEISEGQTERQRLLP